MRGKFFYSPSTWGSTREGGAIACGSHVWDWPRCRRFAWELTQNIWQNSHQNQMTSKLFTSKASNLEQDLQSTPTSARTKWFNIETNVLISIVDTRRDAGAIQCRGYTVHLTETKPNDLEVSYLKDFSSSTSAAIETNWFNLKDSGCQLKNWHETCRRYYVPGLSAGAGVAQCNLLRCKVAFDAYNSTANASARAKNSLMYVRKHVRQFLLAFESIINFGRGLSTLRLTDAVDFG